jgi:hypothetical protein
MYSKEYAKKLDDALDFACDCFDDCDNCPCCEATCDYSDALLNHPPEGTIDTWKVQLNNMFKKLTDIYYLRINGLIDKIVELNKLDDKHVPIVVYPDQVPPTRVSSSTTSTTVSPKYYAEGENQWECGDAMINAYGEQAFLDFCLCNSLKYLWRAREKGGNDDIRKAINYLNKYLEVEEAKPT